MPFKPQHLGPQIRGAQQDLNRELNATPTPEFGGSAQRAKESAAKWVSSGMRNAQQDSAAPWYTGVQPFTQLRLQSPQQFEEWKTVFRTETDMGSMFAPPPPAPAAAPAAAPVSGSDAPKEAG